MTFTDQLKENKNPAITKIADYLLTRTDMREKLDNEKKSLVGMFDYVRHKARKLSKSNCVCVDDETVYGWAVHYYDEEEIKVLKKETTKSINSSIKTELPKLKTRLEILQEKIDNKEQLTLDEAIEYKKYKKPFKKEKDNIVKGQVSLFE